MRKNQTIHKQTKSKIDYTLFFCHLFLFGLLALAFSIPFWKTDYFIKVEQGSTIHILLGLGYVFVFVMLPIYFLSLTLIRFIVDKEQIRRVDWFGLRRRTLYIPHSSELSLKRETAAYRFKIFPFNSRYNEYKTLCIQTQKGKRLRIQSRYMKNFGQLNIAIRKANT